MENLKARSYYKPKPELADNDDVAIEGVALDARHLGVKTHQGVTLLNDITLVIHPGELVILAGPEGSGVSALIHALAGLGRVSDGEILINGLKLHDNYKSLRSRIGFVPPDDIAHPDLTGFEALDHASRLRLPRLTSSGERQKRIEMVLSMMDLQEMSASRIRSLDAEMKKRIAVAIELLTDPGILFIEEPFSSLDAPSANRFFRFLRWISRRGLTVVLTTHSVEFLEQADKVGFLTSHKSLAWYGPPGEALEYFAPYEDGSAQDHKLFGFSEIYDLLDNPTLGASQDWAAIYLASPASKTYTSSSSKTTKPELALDERPLARIQGRLNESIHPAAPRLPSAFSQWVVLSRRNLKLVARDRIGLLLLLVAPLLVVWTDFIFSSRQMYDLTLGDSERISASLALLIFLAMTIGSIPWIREFHKEATVYQHERQVMLKITPYILSKVWIVGLFAIYQGLIWVPVHFIAAALPFEISLAANFFALMVLVIFVGGLLGLFTSFLMPSENKSLLLLAVLLIPQLIFSGAFLPFSKLNPVISSIASVIPSHLAFQGLSTADGHGAVLASDSCWQLPSEQRESLTDQQKQSSCSCLGINIFSLCNFPGILRFYNQALDQSEPVMPTLDQAFKFPDPPTPAQGETLEQYAQEVKDSFATALEANLATSGVYQSKLTQYMNDLTGWETERKSAINKAEGQLEQEFTNYAPDYHANLSYIFLGLVGEAILIVLLLILSVKRKDFRRNEPY